MISPNKETVVIGLYGQVLDRSTTYKRWQRWRPSLSILMHEDFVIDRFELLVLDRNLNHAQQLIDDMKTISPETQVRVHSISIGNPWDFEEVFASLLSFAKQYEFDPDAEDYLIHITTGTHVAQICLFLLTEAGYLPGKLLQTSPGRGKHTLSGSFQTIDLDLSKYDAIASRFRKDQEDAQNFLKSGIATRNPEFNKLIAQIEVVAIRSQAPILLMGPTGAGKSHLAKRIYELKRLKRQLSGRLVEVNCATLHGDAAMSALFGHVRGAFTGALQDRPGLLKVADQGMVFLDEIGELGLDEQAMLLRALEERTFMPVGSDQEAQSEFQLIAGTNQNLAEAVAEGRFREDLLARINLWTFTLLGLRDRKEDIEPNLNYELDRYSQVEGQAISFNKEAYQAYLQFATGPEGSWSANFRDLNASVTRMATLANSNRINQTDVAEEIERLRDHWQRPDSKMRLLERYFSKQELEDMDLFDRLQLAQIIEVCKQCQNLSQAGRRLFAVSRTKKASKNDSDRLRKYLAKFNLDPKRLFAQ